ncbi:MAG: sortase, partial [Chloroflexota bacterium]
PIRGPFADLKKLVPGDEITYIVNNKKYSYEVSRLLFADPSRVDLILKDDGDQIILVTCGEVDFSTGLSKDRLIVSADLVSVEEFQLSRSN